MNNPVLKSDKNKVEDQYTFLIPSHSILLRMKNVSDKCCGETRNTHFMFDFFFSKILPFMRSCEKIFRAV
jgi:hypothetical protein